MELLIWLVWTRGRATISGISNFDVSNLPIFERFCQPIFAHRSIKKAAEAGGGVESGFTPLPTWQDAVSRYLKEAKL